MKLCDCGCGLPTRVAARTRSTIGHVKGEPIRFLVGHANRGVGGFAPFDEVDTGFASPCWIWAKSKSRNTGYGKHFHNGRCVSAHRFMYELRVGPIPDGFQLDHLCRVRACVNPDHLEPVTGRENILRGVGPSAVNAAKAECSKGHGFTSENTAYTREGHRVCIQCRRAASLRWYHRQRADERMVAA